VIEKVVHDAEHGLTTKELGPNAEEEVTMHARGHRRTSMQDTAQPLGSHTDIKATALVETAQEAAAIAKEITDHQFGVTPEERQEAERAAVELARAAESVRAAVNEAVTQAVADTPVPENMMEDAVAAALAERTVATEAATDAFHEAADAIRAVGLASPGSQSAAAFAANAAVARAEQVVVEAKTGQRRASEAIVEQAEQAAQAAADALAEAVVQTVSHVNFDSDTVLAAELVAALPEEVVQAVASAVANVEANSEATAHPPETPIPTVDVRM